jgi:hypothetical protein
VSRPSVAVRSSERPTVVLMSSILWGRFWTLALKLVKSTELCKFLALICRKASQPFRLPRGHPPRRSCDGAAILNRMNRRRVGCDMKKHIVRADGELRMIRCAGVPLIGEWSGHPFHRTLVDITERRPRRRSSVAARRIASKRKRSPAASAGIYRAENWFARTRLFEFLRTIGASTDTPSPSSAYIQKI